VPACTQRKAPSFPKDVDRILAESGVLGDDRKVLHGRLRDQQSIERIFVEIGQPFQGEGVIERRREDLNAVGLLRLTD